MTTIVRCTLRVGFAAFLLLGTILANVVDEPIAAVVGAGMVLFLMIGWSVIELVHEELPTPQLCRHGSRWDDCPDCRH